MAALLLVALLSACLLIPSGAGISYLQYVVNKHVINTNRKSVAEDNHSTVAAPHGEKTSRNADYYNDAAAATVALNSQEQYSMLAEKAKALGVSVRWIPALRRAMLHGKDADVRKLLSDDEFADQEVEYNILLSLIPEKSSEHIIGPSGRPFYDTGLKWMGMEKDGKRGQGVRIALLDTAVDTSVSALEEANIISYDPFGLGAKPDSHGTMVASLLAGSSEYIQGAANDAEILSIPVMDTDGNGYVFNLAEGIVAAADAGANIISMSVTCPYESPTLKAAVDYAISKGCVIVAAAGNEGVDVDGASTVGFPAAYDGVIAVGAVNADGIRAGFSSTGKELIVTAPGVGIIAEGCDGYDLFSGTSSAAPLAAGAIAYVMSKKDTSSAIEAAKILLENTNDTGMPGVDEEYGLGQLNVERALKSDVQGYNDSAASDVILRQNDDGSRCVYFSGQNRGNDSLGEMILHCTLHFEEGESITEDIVFNNVSSNQTVSLKMEVPVGAMPLFAELSVTSSAEDDANSKNDSLRRVLQIAPKTEDQ